jgi:glutamine amidotransferase
MSQPNLLIVDYGMGNIRSVHNAFIRLGCAVTLSQSAADFKTADAIILPGVGAFGEAMANLNKLNLVEPLRDAALNQKKPFLGICLGMQLLAESSAERGENTGLSLIPGRVEKIPAPAGLRLPHVGWNSVRIHKPEPLFATARDGESFYFVHSYHFTCAPDYIAATTDYGTEVVAAVQRDNVYGVQFHPERSQASGLRLLANFTRVVSEAAHA